MAYVVKRPSDRFEIRESESTPRGPRARTLASFRELSDDVLDRAAARARRRLDRARLRARAVALGAAVAPPEATAAAHRLLRAVGRGDRPPPGVGRLLARALTQEPGHMPADHLEAMLPWLAADDAERSRSLVDLLDLADALPVRPRGALRFPWLAPR